MPPICLDGFTDNSDCLEPNHYITGLWAASQAGRPVGYHDTNYRGTEIGEHRDKKARVKGMGT